MRRILYNTTSTKINRKTVNQESILKRVTLFVSSLALIGLVLSPALYAGVTGTAAPGSGANVKPAGELVIKNKYCVACHNVNVKMVGPAFKDIAEKYTEADTAYLVNKVLKGSQGVWGQIPMPPNAVTEQEATQAVTWILNLK